MNFWSGGSISIKFLSWILFSRLLVNSNDENFLKSNIAVNRQISNPWWLIDNFYAETLKSRIYTVHSMDWSCRACGSTTCSYCILSYQPDSCFWYGIKLLMNMEAWFMNIIFYFFSNLTYSINLQYLRCIFNVIIGLSKESAESSKFNFSTFL